MHLRINEKSEESEKKIDVSIMISLQEKETTPTTMLTHDSMCESWPLEIRNF